MAKKLFDLKLTKTDKKVLKGVALGIGALALIGAGGKVAQRFGK